MTLGGAHLQTHSQTSVFEGIQVPTVSDLYSRQAVNHVEMHHLLTEKYQLLH